MVVRYPAEDKPDQILKLLHQQRESGLFCDVKLKLGPSILVHAHRAVLACGSSFFEGMFTSTFIESSSGIVDLSHITNDIGILWKVIDSMYGQSFEICQRNVGETLNLATMFLLDDLKSACAEVLLNVLHLKNVAEILLLSINYDLRDVQDAVIPIFRSRFHDSVMFQEELLEYSSDQLKQAISIANIEDIARKGDYIKLLLKWFCFNATGSRADCLFMLLAELPFKIIHTIYRETESEIAEVIGHLNNENFNLFSDNMNKLRKMLESFQSSNHEIFPLWANNLISSVNDKHEIELDLNNEPKKLNCLSKDDCQMEEDVYNRHQSKVTELSSEPRLVDAVVVLAPGRDYFERSANCIDNEESQSLDICAYIPDAKAWYKLGSVCMNITQTSEGVYCETPSHLRRLQFTADFCKTKKEFRELVDGHDIPRLSDQVNPVRQRTGEGRMQNQTSNHGIYRRHISHLPPLSNKNWSVTYLRHSLYFYHQDMCELVLRYDLTSQSFTQTYFDAVENWDGAPITVEGTELVVVDQTLYAVVRIVIYEDRKRDYSRSMGRPAVEEAQVLHKLYRFNEEKNMWSHFINSKKNHVTIQLPRLISRKSESMRGFHSFQAYIEIPTLRQPGTFRSVLFARDDTTLFIVLCVKGFDDKPGYYCMSDCSVIDVRTEEVKHIRIPVQQRYLRQPIALFNNNTLVFINDNLELTVQFDSQDLKSYVNISKTGKTVAENESRFLIAKESYPTCRDILTCDGQQIWILQGSPNYSSSLKQYKVSNCAENGPKLNEIRHPPPPFSAFAMTCTGKLEINLVHMLQPPTKYLQT